MTCPPRKFAVAMGALICVLLPIAAAADILRVATAANFAATLQEIAAAFARETGHRVLLSSGSTGKFHTQISNGAPFDILLAADEKAPALLEAQQLAVAGSRFTYARGKLVLWSAEPGRVDGAGNVLKGGAFARLAIANPNTAPYGAAALQTLASLGLRDFLRAKFVQADNITQAYQFVSSGNAELGFVALSQVYRNGTYAAGSAWLVPATRYAPLHQDAVLLKPGKDKPAARQLLAYLRQPTAKGIIRAWGYDTPP